MNESYSILDRLEFEIEHINHSSSPKTLASCQLGSDGVLEEYDPATQSLLGIRDETSPRLDSCEHLDATNRRRLAKAAQQLCQPDSEEDEAFVRLRLGAGLGTSAFCVTLKRCEDRSGKVSAVCLFEPLSQSPASVDKQWVAPANSFDFWYMKKDSPNFQLVSGRENIDGKLSPTTTTPLSDWLDRIHAEDRSKFSESFRAFLDGATNAFQMRYRIRKDCGDLKWVSTIARRQEANDEGYADIVGLHRDENEIPGMHDDLRLFSYLARKVHLAIVITDPSGKVTWHNKAFTDMTGYALEEIAGKTYGSILHGALTDADTIRYIRDRIRKGKGLHAEIINYKKNGVPFWVRMDATPLLDESGKVVRYVSFETDITESKKTQSAILRNEIKFRSLFDNSLDGLLLLSPKDGAIIEANRAAIEFFDTPRLVGQRVDEIFPDSQIFKVAQLNELVDQSDGTRRETGEYVTESGERRPVEVTVHRTPIGEAIALFVTLRDVSEKRALEEQLRHAQRMEAVGRLAGGIAHDFNNLLAGLRGFSELLCNSKDLIKRDHVYAHEILKITDRASKLTSRLLSFSRGKSDKPVVSDLNDLVSNLTPMLSRILKKDMHFASKLDPDLPNVRIDPAQIEQVVMNLVVNGQEAIVGHEGLVSLNTQAVDLDGQEIMITGQPKPGRYAAVSVTDNGQGMPAEVLEKIFEPFFTTKKGAGTGLGLSIVYGIIQNNGGHLMVDSVPNKGTTFSFFFPEVKEAIAKREVTDLRREMPSVERNDDAPPTILVAEDQEQVREILELGLGQSGYNLIIAHDGRQAIDLATAHEGKIDLLLTDSIMPKASGYHVTKTVKSLYPDIRVIMMSGLPQQESPEHKEAQIDSYVDKPFSIRNLLELIESLLASKA